YLMPDRRQGTSRIVSAISAWVLLGALAMLNPAASVADSAPTMNVGLAQGQTTPPRIFFTDLESGPKSGGQDNLGVFITIWGKGFGASRGSSVVTLGGQEVARYVTWGANNAAARSLDMIVVQPGSNAQTGDLVVTVGGQPSNPLPFTIRSGAIYFVIAAAPNADDTNPGTYDAPFKTIYKPRTVVQAGDVVYIKGGQFTQIDPINPGWDAILLLDTEDAATGTANLPVAWIGYPGDPPTLANPLARRSILFFTSGSPQSYYVIANMIFSQSLNPLSLAGTGHRIIGNILQDGAFDDSGAISINGDCTGFKVFGNLLQRNGTVGEKLHHAIYLGGYGANTNMEVAWNHVQNQHGGRAIQLFGHLDGDRIDGVLIHDNLLIGSELNNIVIGGSDGSNDVIGTVHFFNNIVLGAMEPGLRINDPAGTVTIQNNVFYNNGLAQIYLQRAGAGKITLEDNIIYALADQTYFMFEPGTDSSAFSPRRNLYYNAGPTPPWDTDSLNADPLFVDAASRDFHLQNLSSAIDAGIATGRNWDYDGTARPQGAAFDIGALEAVQIEGGNGIWLLY
ncbi:MAG: choice-of-anchor Q domain-containing protein, partial [bacterium]